MQRRKILDTISEKITYKDKTFDIELRPIFQTIAQNQYNLTINNCGNELLTSSTLPLPHNNRTLENGTKKGLETELSPYNRKNSIDVPSLEHFTQKLYNNLIDISTVLIVQKINELALLTAC